MVFVEFSVFQMRDMRFSRRDICHSENDKTDSKTTRFFSLNVLL